MDRSKKIIAILDKIAEWSLYILILMLPISKSIIEITIVTGLLSLVARKIISKERLLSSEKYIDIFLYCFLVASLTSLWNTDYMALSLRAFFSKALKFAALFFITREIINSKEKLNNFIIMALLSCMIVLVDAVIQYFITHIDLFRDYVSFKYVLEYFCPNAQQVRHGAEWFFKTTYFIGFPTASFPFPNDFAAWIIVFIFPTCLYAVTCRKNILKRVISGIIFSGLFYFLILTKARGAWLGFMTALGCLSFFKLKKLAIILFVVILFGTLLINRSLIPDILGLTSVNDRVTMWKNGWEIFKKHPIIGNGLNTFYVNYAKVRDDDYKNKKGSYAHNCYLQMAAETGVLGLISFLLFIAALIFKGLRSVAGVGDPPAQALILGISLGLVAFLVHSLVDTNLYSLNLAALFWISSGLLLAVIKIARSEI